ncbi:uncharacterized protein LOC132301434 [Cornus florida]|uniref:uncharacterized protein LOC132301434 n=1 Tax=Cornus florida TaxID=4283 RepID=UPI002897D7BC|nr:uncharacterized protein LOC132301434 [Cornus florida]
MELQIFSWNVRGLNDSVRRKVVKSVIRKGGGHVVCLQETKLASTSDGMVHHIWGGRFVEWIVLDVDGVPWVFSGVYGPTEDSVRHLLWEELGEVRRQWMLPWCVGGDFNVVRSPFKRSTRGRWTSDMELFSKFIDEFRLIDLPLEGGPFTWSSGCSPPTLSRLDRFLVSKEWEEMFSDVVLRSRRSSFRFGDMWLRAKGFLDRIRFWWEVSGVVGTPSHSLTGHLRRLKGSIKIWNK